jgi:OTU domain-containing protein 3
MARKKYLDAEDAENQHHHLSNASKSGQLLHDNTNIKFGPQQKVPLNTNGKNATPSHKKGNKHKNSAAGKTNSDDSFGAVMSQLSTTGLTLREMPGDGNCLFRALADQLEGDSRNHMDHRRAVVDFMKKHRPDFEPFVEDDEPFEKYIQSLAQNGTFAGNDAIVAFARLHDVTVVIHQLDSPAWLIQPSNEASYSPSGREIHIAYHNGDHYNSVRKLGDNSDAPANVKLGLQGHTVCASKTSLQNSGGKTTPPHSTSSLKPQATPFVTEEAPDFKTTEGNVYESLLYGRRDEDYWVKDSSDIERLVAEVMEQTDFCCSDPNLVRETLMEFHFDITSTVDYILSMSYFIMAQPQEDQQPQEVHEVRHSQENRSEGADAVCRAEINDVNKSTPSPTVEPKLESLEPSNQENCNGTISDTITNSGSSMSTATAFQETPVDDNSKTEASPPHSQPSQNQENVGPKSYKVKISTRQKKDLKKKERKREANQRKLGENTNSSTSPVIAPSNLETLSI